MVTDVQIKWKTFIVEWRLPTLFYRKSAGTTPERNLHPFQIRLQPLQVDLLTAQFELQPVSNRPLDVTTEVNTRS